MPLEKLKTHPETTLFNFYVDEGRGLGHTATVKLFREIAAGKYEAYTSAYVLDELEQAPAEKQDKMMGLIAEYNISVLEYSEEADALANVYVEEGVVPSKYRTDGVHIAISAVNDLDMVVSMNFQHIVKRKTKIATGSINILNGYRAVEIYNPMEVVEDEND